MNSSPASPAPELDPREETGARPFPRSTHGPDDSGVGQADSCVGQPADSITEPDDAPPDDWMTLRRQAAAERARLLAARHEAEHARAGRIVSLFLAVAQAEGLAPQPLRVQGYAGGSARTSLSGWYLRGDRTVALDTEGHFYALTARLSWIERIRGYQPTPEPVPLVIGEGGRDGDVIDLREALDMLLPGWEQRSPEPLG